MSVVFDKYWFKEHQSKILWFINHRFYPLRLWSRWILRIRKFDCNIKEDIYEIQPNNYKVKLPNGQIRADFRTHTKFSKRLYHAFKYIWYILHYIDSLRIPQLQFGFDTLTVYPNANPETVSVDGRVSTQFFSSGTTWANCHDDTVGAGGLDSETTMVANITSRTTTDTWYYIQRSGALFVTSSIGSGTVSAATLSLYYQSKANGFAGTSPTLNIFSFNPASNTAIAAGDIDAFGTTAYSSDLAYADFNSGYEDFSFNATGVAAIDTSGVSKFGIREAAYDAANSAPTWSVGKTMHMTMYAADQSGTANDPKLVVTYTLPDINQKIHIY